MTVRGHNVFYIALMIGVLLYPWVGFAMHSESARRSLVSAARRGDITVMKLWLLAGAHANTWASTGDSEWPVATLLQAAVMGGQTEAVRFLLAHGAEVHSSDLSLADERGTAEIRSILLTEQNGRRVCQDSSSGGNLLLTESEAGHEELVRLLLSSGCGTGYRNGDWGFKETALRRAIVHNQRGVVAALLEAGANVNHLSESEIALGGIPVLQVALNHKNPEIIALVKQAGAK